MKDLSVGFVRSHYLALVIVSVSALLVASIALAEIVSGSFTTNTSTNISITNLALSKPVSVVAGDFRLANVTPRGGAAEGVTAPAGWTEIRRTDNATNVSIVSYWKIAGDSEPAVYTWTITPQTRAVGGITRYTGVDATNPIDTSSGNTGRSNIATASSITTASSNEEIVALFAADARIQFSTPTGMVEKYDTSNGSSPSTAEDDALQAAAGATGAKTATISSGKRNWVAQLIALQKESPEIAFDNSTLNTADYNVSSSAFSHTVNNNTNGLLVVTVEFNPDTPYAITGVTYDGVPLTDTGWHPSDPLIGGVSVWYLFSPHAGTHNVVVTASSPAIRNSIAASYTGVKQSGFPDSSGTGNPEIDSVPKGHKQWAVSTIANNSWVITSFVKNGSSIPTADTGTTIRQMAEPGSNINFADSNGPVINAGTYEIGATTPDPNKWAAIFFSIAPAN